MNVEIKEICRDLGITQRELAEKIGMTPEAFNNAISKNKISKQTIKSIELLQENIRLKKELKKLEKIQEILNSTFS